MRFIPHKAKSCVKRLVINIWWGFEVRGYNGVRTAIHFFLKPACWSRSLSHFQNIETLQCHSCFACLWMENHPCSAKVQEDHFKTEQDKAATDLLEQRVAMANLWCYIHDSVLTFNMYCLWDTCWWTLNTLESNRHLWKENMLTVIVVRYSRFLASYSRN